MTKGPSRNIHFPWDDLKKISLAVFLSVTLLSIAVALTAGGLPLAHYIHNDPFDTFMDYFNVLAGGSSGNPYLTANGNNYPPLCYFIVKAMHKLIPLDSFPTPSMIETGSKALYYRNLEYGLFPFAVLLLAIVIVQSHCIETICSKKIRTGQLLLVTATFFSGPFLFLLERGNLILVTLPLVFAYLAYRDSEKSWKRNLAYVSIAFAAGLKIYPFIFAFLELREGKNRAFLKIVGWTCLLYGVPFLYFGGIRAIKGMLIGLTEFVDSTTNIGFGNQYGAIVLLRSIAEMTGLDFIGGHDSLVILFVLMAGITSIFHAPKGWQAVLVAGMLCVMVPSVSFTYALVFLLPGLVMAYADEGHGSHSETLMYCLALFSVSFILTPYISFPGNGPAEVRYPLTWGCLLQNIALVISFCGMSITSLKTLLEMRLVERLSKSKDE